MVRLEGAPMSEHFAIELARDADLPRITALANRAAETGIANFATAPEPETQWMTHWELTRATHPWLVARSGEQVIGFAKASPHHARGAYRWTAELTVYIDEDWHGRGVGTALYAVLIPLLRDQGYVTLVAAITAGQAASERLHARAGFVRCGTLHAVGWKLGGWHDVGFWELPLRPAGAPPVPIRPVLDVWAARPVSAAG
jgi:phosphinothricin acetyltransferase